MHTSKWRKIQLNSAYGAIGNQYFRYYKLANEPSHYLDSPIRIENKMLPSKSSCPPRSRLCYRI